MDKSDYELYEEKLKTDRLSRSSMIIYKWTVWSLGQTQKQTSFTNKGDGDVRNVCCQVERSKMFGLQNFQKWSEKIFNSIHKNCRSTESKLFIYRI